jgi:hypothetical protein
MRRMEKARKKAETICEADDVPSQEKLRQIQRYVWSLPGFRGVAYVTSGLNPGYPARYSQDVLRLKRCSYSKICTYGIHILPIIINFNHFQ